MFRLALVWIKKKEKKNKLQMLIFIACFKVLTKFQYLLKPDFFYTFILFHQESLFISPTAKGYSALLNTVYNNVNNNI